MKLSISNIAWALDDSSQVAELMQEAGVTGVEIAPTARWPDPTTVADPELKDFRAFWEDRGIPIVAMQSLLYGRPELRLFEDDASRARMLEVLKRLMHVADVLGAGPMVFGSPKNRLRGELEPARATEIAVDFFREAGDAAGDHGVMLCVEPNPEAYGCDFVTNVAEGVALVREVDRAGFGLHLDAAGMLLAGDDGPGSIRDAMRETGICHFHVSEPHLSPIGRRGEGDTFVDHAALAEALGEVAYSGWCSVEMRSVEPEESIDELRRVLAFHAAAYGDGCGDGDGDRRDEGRDDV